MADRKSGSPKKAMHSLWSVAACLGCLWVVSLLYGEMIAFWVPVWTCSWPSLATSQKSDSSMNNTVKVAVIADPQLTDRTTHGMQSGSFALKATQFFSDIYMRRSFRTTVLALNPDEIVFLGDYFDGGPYLSDNEFNESLARFWHIFDQSQRGAKVRFSTIPSYFLSGNHDLGYAGFQAEKPQILERYKRAFGETAHTNKIGAVDFVFVDAQALDGSITDVRTNNAWSFIQNVSSKVYNTHPKVLLSHIPLYRPDNTPCGILRSSQVINQRITWSRSGSPKIVYQNYLSEETTVRLLDLLTPVLVLSGHDHDQCTVKHRTSTVSVLEHTVGSFSWQNGNLYPSFLLLSVARTTRRSQEGIMSSRLCFLPYQTFIYIWYAILFVISMVILLTWPSQGIDWEGLYRKLSLCSSKMLPGGGVKEKQEDADYDYEMVWDAEGSMHLIRKESTQSASRSGENQTVARTTALAHSVVKRTTSVDVSNTSTTPALSDQIKSEGFLGLPRPSRTVFGSVTRRLKQVIGPLVALASVNVGLYVMLMMNDWTGI